ncbi:MAG: hypothetical protein OSB46_15650 [Alphaproteobacteria bacterium]|nr:hypothetical protein [Alphaproteobacteria bacterium]
MKGGTMGSSDNPQHPLVLTSSYRLFFLMSAISGTVSMVLWLAEFAVSVRRVVRRFARHRGRAQLA